MNATVAHYQHLAGGRRESHGDLRRLRERAIARFAALGFPTKRDEAWHYTSVAPIAATAFAHAADVAIAAPAREDLARRLGVLTGAPALFFVNGQLVPTLSGSWAPPDGVRVQSLAAALCEEPSLAGEHLGRYADMNAHAFVALNTAFIEDGAVVRVAPGAALSAPIHLVYLSVGGAEPVMACPRTLVVAGANSQVTIVEHYLALDPHAAPEIADAPRAFTNAVTEIVVEDGARVDHYKWLQESGFHVGMLAARLGRASAFTSHALSFAAALGRNEAVVTLGEGAECQLRGLTLARGEHFFDNRTLITHEQPRATSRENFKAVVGERATSVFDGKIVVAAGAQKTDAAQSNKNLLLSREATAYSKPHLEIYADDVKVAHGATSGQLEEEGLFYLRSRGIDAQTARGLLAYAFASEIIASIKPPDLRARAEAHARTWLSAKEGL